MDCHTSGRARWLMIPPIVGEIIDERRDQQHYHIKNSQPVGRHSFPGTTHTFSNIFTQTGQMVWRRRMLCMISMCGNNLRKSFSRNSNLSSPVRYVRYVEYGTVFSV
jgi:hypothetical protein